MDGFSSATTGVAYLVVHQTGKIKAIETAVRVQKNLFFAADNFKEAGAYVGPVAN